MSKTITRKYIQRITKREGNTNIRQISGGGGGGGGASQYWVDENYISKLFFNQLFTVYDEDGNVVEPNDTESVIASIKSMFGFWTDAYLSALGNGEGGGAELTLASLADVDVHGVANGQALVYDATTQKWVPGQGGGIDITAMWAALAQSGVQQIDASHLATALTGYATETWVGNQGYITGSALNGYATESWVGSQISDMATQTWVSGNYLSQTNAAATYLTQTNAAATYLTKTDAATTYVSIAFFERLFKAYNGSTVVHPNNTTSTIDNIKAMFGFWTDFYLSALGNGSGGSTPGVTMAQVWSALGNSTTEQINISHLTNALSGYNPTDNFKTINGNSIIGTGNIVIQGGGGTVTAVKVGTTTYNPTNGVVSLPEYLPLSGGTMSGGITMATASSGFNDKGILFGDDGSCGRIGGTTSGRVAIYSSDNIYLRPSSVTSASSYGVVISSSTITYNGNTMWHAGNDGSGSGLDADLLDGLHSYEFPIMSFDGTTELTTGDTCDLTSVGTYYITGKSVSASLINPPFTESNFRLWHFSTGQANYPAQLAISFREGMAMRGKNNTTWYDWKYFAFKDDNVASATKLKDTRTIWGQSFDGTANVSGNMTDVGNITSNVSGEWGIYKLTEPIFRVASSGLVISPYDKSEGWVAIRTGTNNITTGEKEIRLLSDGNVGIGTKSPSYKLHVAGTFYASGNSSIGGTLGVSGLLTANGGITIPSGKTLTIGDAVLSWDSTNQGIKITKGLYSQTFIAALGQGSSGSSGVDMNTVWTALGNATTEQINASHLSTALSTYATQSWVMSQIPSVVDAYTKTESDNRYYALYGGTNLNPSSTNPVNIDTLITAGNYYCSNSANTQYVSTLPSGVTKAFHLWVGAFWTGTRYIYQRIQQFSQNNVYERYSSASTTSWSDWYLVQDNLAKYVSSSSLATTLSDYVTIAGTQTITGAKTFTSNITIHTETTTEEDAFSGLSLSVKDTTTGQTFSKSVIRGHQDHNASTSNGFNLVIGGGGNTFIGSGEAANHHYDLYKGNTSERLYLTSDGTVYIQANANTIGNRKGIAITTSGNVVPMVADEYSTKTSNLGTADYRFDNLFVGGINADAEIYLSTNNKNIYAKDKDGTDRGILRLNSDNILVIGNGLRSIASSTGIYAGTDGFYVCTNGATKRMFIDSSGNVGIGTTSPSYKLSVSGDVSASNFRGALIGNADSATTAAACTGNAASATKLQTSRSIWGQSFDGSADISGAISGATTISASSNVSIGGTLSVTGVASLSSNLTVAGNLGVGTASPSYALDVVGHARAKLLYFYNRANTANAGYIGVGSASVDYIYFQAYANNGLFIGANNGFDFVILPNHNVGVGTTEPSYKMHVSGVVYASTGVYSGGYVTALSDIRHKDVKGDVNLTVSEVANAPSVKFLWKDRRQEGMQVGSIAQYWKKVMPEAIVENADGELTMSYGVIALLASIATARKVENHERRIRELEEENKKLKQQLNAA